jgi:hydrogenase maturation factor HypF (carbamoyltransferase family)
MYGGQCYGHYAQSVYQFRDVIQQRGWDMQYSFMFNESLIQRARNGLTHLFMKSDCTHRLNKGEVSKGDIVLSLSKVMADKVSEFLTKAKISSGQVVLTGGVTRNRFLVEFIRESRPGIDFVLPDEAPYFESFGAAHLARNQAPCCRKATWYGRAQS